MGWGGVLALELARSLALAGEPVAGQEAEASVEAEPSAEAGAAEDVDAGVDPELPALEELPELEPLAELPELEPLPAVPAASPDGARSPIAAGSDDAPADDGGLRLRDVMTGSLRMMGAFLHVPDVPEIYPAGDDALLATVGRVIVDRNWNDRFGLELNYFIDLGRLPAAGGGTGGAFGTAGTIGSVYRTPLLSWTLWENGTVQSTAGVDRFAFDAKLGPVSLRAGRFPVTYGVTTFFTPNDFFAPFSVTAINRIYKPGVDALQVGVALGMIGSVEVTGAIGNDDEGVPTWARSAMLARSSVLGGGFEWAVLGGKLAERWVVGGSFQGGIEVVGLRGEVHLGVPDAEGDGHDADDAPLHVRLAAGPSLNVGWKNLTLGAEYAFYSDGAERPADLLARAGRLFPDDVPLLGRHYVGAVVGMELIPILQANALTLVDAGDGSGLAGLSLAYSVADEADLIAGMFIPWGKDPVLTMDPTMPVALRSAYGASPLAIYLEARTFF